MEILELKTTISEIRNQRIDIQDLSREKLTVWSQHFNRIMVPIVLKAFQEKCSESFIFLQLTEWRIHAFNYIIQQKQFRFFKVDTEDTYCDMYLSPMPHSKSINNSRYFYPTQLWLNVNFLSLSPKLRNPQNLDLLPSYQAKCTKENTWLVFRNLGCMLIFTTISDWHFLFWLSFLPLKYERWHSLF